MAPDRVTERAPDEVRERARLRSEARRMRDWPTADRLRAEIEAAGWQVVDQGLGYRLEAHASSARVPSRLMEPASAPVSVVLVRSEHGGLTAEVIAGLREGAPEGMQVILVSDDGGVGVDPAVEDAAAAEVVRTSTPLGYAASLNAGIRRAAADVVVIARVVPERRKGADLAALIEVLGDPAVGVCGGAGLASSDLRRFEWTAGPMAAAVSGPYLGFRRTDYAERGPLDERFQLPLYLDIWWSLCLRDEGEERPPRTAVVVPLIGSPAPAEGPGAPERSRDERRDFYRLLDRFGGRRDLAIEHPPGSG
jgi:hypothetical protein